MKSLMPFLVVFAVLILAAWSYASYDPITSAVVEARVEISAGPVIVDVLDQALAWILKFLGVAAIAGFFGFVWNELRKRNAMWWQENTSRRWRGGPNAQFQQQRSALPKLKLEELMLLALSGKRLPQVGVQEERNPQDEIKLDF